MQKFVYVILSALMMVLLTACNTTSVQPSKPISDLAKNLTKPVSVLELPPPMISTDWRHILSPMIDELIQTSDIGENNRVLVSDVKNNSGNYVSPSQINNVLFSLMAQQDIFAPIDKSFVTQAKQTLGIPYDDALVSRSKMIGLARHLNADYLLFTTIKQTPQSPNIPGDVSMELLLTKSGEIVWQFSSPQFVDQDHNEQDVIDASIYNTVPETPEE